MSKAFAPLLPTDIFGPTGTVGEVVNVHVVSYVAEPQPDFEAMQRVIAGGTKDAPTEVAPRAESDREVPAKL